MPMMSTETAASRLGVSVRQVQRLAAAGELDLVGTDRIASASVEHLARTRHQSHARAWTEETAWGAVALLAGTRVDWMGQSQKSRLKSRLRAMNAAQLAAATRHRASVRRYFAHPAARSRIAATLVEPGAGRELGMLTNAERVDGYVDVDEGKDLIDRYDLDPDGAGDIVLRVTSFALSTVEMLAKASTALAALDLTDSPDPRERATGQSILNELLAIHRG